MFLILFFQNLNFITVYNHMSYERGFGVLGSQIRNPGSIFHEEAGVLRYSRYPGDFLGGCSEVDREVGGFAAGPCAFWSCISRPNG